MSGRLVVNGNISWELDLDLDLEFGLVDGLVAAFIHELDQNGIENNKTKHP